MAWAERSTWPRGAGPAQPHRGLCGQHRDQEPDCGGSKPVGPPEAKRLRRGPAGRLMGRAPCRSMSWRGMVAARFADPSSRVPGTLRDARTQEFCPTRTRNGLEAVMISERLASKAALLRGAKNPPNHKLHRTAGGLAKETKARGEQQEGTAPCSPGLPLSPS